MIHIYVVDWIGCTIWEYNIHNATQFTVAYQSAAFVSLENEFDVISMTLLPLLFYTFYFFLYILHFLHFTF